MTKKLGLRPDKRQETQQSKAITNIIVTTRTDVDVITKYSFMEETDPELNPKFPEKSDPDPHLQAQ
jgi:hypothetical protein